MEDSTTNESIKKKAEDFINKCNVHNLASAKEGGVIYTSELLVDFIKEIYTEDKIKKIIGEYDKYVESHINREAEAALCCNTPISSWDMDKWLEGFIKREFKEE